MALRCLGRAWREADERMVISMALGEEYCERYGRVSYAIVTDGLTDQDFLPRSRDAEVLRVYFAGLFHRGYPPNLRTLLRALDLLRDQTPGASRVASMSLRSAV